MHVGNEFSMMNTEVVLVGEPRALVGIMSLLLHNITVQNCSFSYNFASSLSHICPMFAVIEASVIINSVQILLD